MITEKSFSLSEAQQQELSHSGMSLQLKAIREWKDTENLHLKTLLLSAIYTLDAMGCEHILTEEVLKELQEIHDRVSPEVKMKIESVLFKN